MIIQLSYNPDASSEWIYVKDESIETLWNEIKHKAEKNVFTLSTYLTLWAFLHRFRASISMLCAYKYIIVFIIPIFRVNTTAIFSLLSQ